MTKCNCIEFNNVSLNLVYVCWPIQRRPAGRKWTNIACRGVQWWYYSQPIGRRDVALFEWPNPLRAIPLRRHTDDGHLWMTATEHQRITRDWWTAIHATPHDHFYSLCSGFLQWDLRLCRPSIGCDRDICCRWRLWSMHCDRLWRPSHHSLAVQYTNNTKLNVSHSTAFLITFLCRTFNIQKYFAPFSSRSRFTFVLLRSNVFVAVGLCSLVHCCRCRTDDCFEWIRTFHIADVNGNHENSFYTNICKDTRWRRKRTKINVEIKRTKNEIPKKKRCLRARLCERTDNQQLLISQSEATRWITAIAGLWWWWMRRIFVSVRPDGCR